MIRLGRVSLLSQLVPQVRYMDVIQVCRVSCGEVEQLVGAARVRDFSSEHTSKAALGRWRRAP
eukprot:scaffold99493_cov90-Phaeocystis_antarctica.AAC.4